VANHSTPNVPGPSPATPARAYRFLDALRATIARETVTVDELIERYGATIADRVLARGEHFLPGDPPRIYLDADRLHEIACELVVEDYWRMEGPRWIARDLDAEDPWRVAP
jgi:hypothetical protein